MSDSRHERIDVRLKRAITTGAMPKELLICGPAGTGKTYPVLSVLHILNREYTLRTLILRATRVSLTESALVTYEQEILPADGCESIAEGAGRSHRHSYRYPSGSEIVVGGLDRNPTRILSTAWDIVYCNEAIELQEEVWETLGSRLSRPGRDQRFGLLLGDTNPSHPEHWLKKRCDSGATTLWETTHEANPLLHDGHDWTAAGIAYLAALDRLTGPRYKRLRQGLWVHGEGMWFATFDPDKHVAERAEYQPGLPVRLAIDAGTSRHTGAVFFQVRQPTTANGWPRVTVFGDYHAVDVVSSKNAEAIRKHAGVLPCSGRIDLVRLDPAADAHSSLGPAAYGEYERVFGSRFTGRWPGHLVLDGLDMIESLLETGNLTIHPRCKHLISAFLNYAKTKRANEWLGFPAKENHPAEDLMDSLRGGLRDAFPEGRVLPTTLRTAHASRVY